MTADRTRSFVCYVNSLLAATLLVAVTSQAQPVLPPAAPDTTTSQTPDASTPAQGNDEHDVLTRGPVHEAFAEPYNADPVEGLIVPKAPPEPIDEVPPETMPDGNNVQWIPGYPAWDDDRQDYIWVSGLWRDVPPGQRFVPGYWTEVTGGYQWVSGFWTSAETTELEYLPQPPETLEQGPNVAAPSDDHFWVPGTWNYADADYHWRPGYWAPAYDDWVWVPDRYVWTPYGYVFCSGYYDYRLPVRAVAFAPVYFNDYHWWHSHSYVPSVVLDVGPLTMHWFVRPNYCHYYFGDYYADAYSTGWGLQPWYTCNYGFGGFAGWSGRNCYYDPLLVFYAGYHRRHHGIDFRRRMRRWHNHYRDHEDFRPRRTVRAQRRFLADLKKRGRNRDRIRNARIGREFDDFVTDREARHGREFVKLDRRKRDRHKKAARETVQLANLRHRTESEGGKRRNGKGRRDGRSGAVVALPDVNESGRKGKGSRRSRKLKLPDNQGAGDQIVVGEAGGNQTKRRSRRAKTPDGPPGRTQAVAERGDSKGRSRSRNRGRDSTNDVAESNQNRQGRTSDNKRDRRRSEGAQQQIEIAPRTENPTRTDGKPRGRNRGKPGSERSLDDKSRSRGGASDSGRRSDSGRNKGRSRSGSRTNNAQPGVEIRPLQQGQSGSKRGNSENGRSRSRSGNRSGSSFEFNNGANSNQGGSGVRQRGTRNSNQGNSNRSNSRRSNRSGSTKSKSNRGGSSSGGFPSSGIRSSNRGNSGNSRANQRSSRSRQSAQSNKRSLNSSGGNSNRQRSAGSGGRGSSQRNSASSGGGSRSRSSGRSSSGGRNKKNKKSKN